MERHGPGTDGAWRRRSSGNLVPFTPHFFFHMGAFPWERKGFGHSTERWQKGSYTYEASGRMATAVVVALAAEIGEGRIGSIGSKSDGAFLLFLLLMMSASDPFSEHMEHNGHPDMT
ncbi:hypothetical protein CRENBAI_026230, partial [Crenichthys baileyi]